MTSHGKLALALLTGVAIGVVALKGLNAQASPPALFAPQFVDRTTVFSTAPYNVGDVAVSHRGHHPLTLSFLSFTMPAIIS